MGYHHIVPDDIEPMPDRSAEARSISDAAGFETLGLRMYTAAPGEQLPLVYHYHDEQEEAFYVVRGTLTVTTPEHEYVIGAGEFFTVAPMHPHFAYNADDADDAVTVVAVGAPSIDDAHPYEE